MWIWLLSLALVLSPASSCQTLTETTSWASMMLDLRAAEPHLWVSGGAAGMGFSSLWTRPPYILGSLSYNASFLPHQVGLTMPPPLGNQTVPACAQSKPQSHLPRSASAATSHQEPPRNLWTFRLYFWAPRPSVLTGCISCPDSEESVSVVHGRLQSLCQKDLTAIQYLFSPLVSCINMCWMCQTLCQALESNMNKSYGTCSYNHNTGSYFLSTCYVLGNVLGL